VLSTRFGIAEANPITPGHGATAPEVPRGVAPLTDGLGHPVIVSGAGKINLQGEPIWS